MIIPLGTSAWASVNESVPAFQLRNMYVVEQPLSVDGMCRVSRPTLSTFATIGTGPIVGIWRQDATFNGDWLVVSHRRLHRVTATGVVSASLGDITGEGYVQIAGTANRVILVRDGVAFSTDGTTVTTVTIPDSLPIQSVAVINGYFILTVRDKEKFFWIAPGGTNPGALDFASAERNPDAVLSVNVISDEVWFIGSSGPEVWGPTGDANAPFQRISGRVYSEGCASRDSVATSSFQGIPCLIWVTNFRSVVMAQGSTKKISTESVEETLRGATNLRAWAFRHNRSDFYVLTFDEGTLVYDINRDNWVPWDSLYFPNWRAHLGAQSGATVVAGDCVDGKLWVLGYDETDEGTPVVRIVSGFVGNIGKPQPCGSVEVKVNAGWGSSLTTEPKLELRWSDDMRTSWSDYVIVGLGLSGSYDKEVVFRSLGQVQRPGRVFEIRVSDPIRIRIDYATMNEA